MPDPTEAAAEAEARREAATLCARLRARDDEDSIHAAAMIEGHLEAFAHLVEDRQRLRRRARDAERNAEGWRELWARGPADVRHRVAHGETA